MTIKDVTGIAFKLSHKLVTEELNESFLKLARSDRPDFEVDFAEFLPTRIQLYCRIPIVHVPIFHCFARMDMQYLDKAVMYVSTTSTEPFLNLNCYEGLLAYYLHPQGGVCFRYEASSSIYPWSLDIPKMFMVDREATKEEQCKLVNSISDHIDLSKTAVMSNNGMTMRIVKGPERCHICSLSMINDDTMEIVVPNMNYHYPSTIEVLGVEYPLISTAGIHLFRGVIANEFKRENGGPMGRVCQYHLEPLPLGDGTAKYIKELLPDVK